MNIRRTVQRLLARASQALTPKPDTTPATRIAASALERLANTDPRQWEYRAAYLERCAELIEAKQMAGSGPWLVGEARKQLDGKELATTESLMKLSEAERMIRLEENNPMISQGAYGDIELALQNVEWRREVNLSWLEFSRWGIQQIILISRLYYIKNPICRRLIDIAATYVFGRGFELSSSDEDANEVLKDFLDRNKKTLGQIALVELEKRKYYDGNLFFAFFSDTTDKGTVDVRTIDATEIFDIVCDPDDSDTPWYYRRGWNARIFDPATGATTHEHKDAWYPALGFNPTPKPEVINLIPVMWDTPVLHRKCGGVAKWHFGCPIIYPVLDWAKAARQYLQDCATIAKSLAQFSIDISTKGGQQAMEGAKQQLMTTVGPSASLWDTNPTAVSGSAFIHGPGTELTAFKTQGAGFDPEKVRRMLLMCCMVVGVPETFLADVSTGNLATATTLDRPTELAFVEKQEAWREDLITIAQYVLQVSGGAAGGKFKASLDRRKLSLKQMSITEAARETSPHGIQRYVAAKAKPKKPTDLQLTVTFPSIREGDMSMNVVAIANAMTLQNKAGQVVGIDEKTGVLMLLKELGWENAEELVEEMYPEKEYDPDRTKEDEPAPLMPIKAQPIPGGQPQPTPAQAANTPPLAQPLPGEPQQSHESVLAVAGKLRAIGEKLLLKDRNGHAE
jgi:hypothetical protein